MTTVLFVSLGVLSTVLWRLCELKICQLCFIVLTWNFLELFQRPNQYAKSLIKARKRNELRTHKSG